MQHYTQGSAIARAYPAYCTATAGCKMEKEHMKRLSYFLPISHIASNKAELRAAPEAPLNVNRFVSIE